MTRDFFRQFAAACGLSLSLALSACGQGPAVNAPDQEEELITAYSWQTIAPSTFAEGPPTTLQLSDGYAYAIFTDSSVFAGETMTLSYTIQGEAGRVVRIVLSRHCDADNGSDYAESYVTLTGEAQAGSVSHAFEQNYSCLRVSFHSHDSNPLTLAVSSLELVKTEPAAATP